MSEKKIHFLEKRVIVTAITVSIIHLSLIAFAVYYYGLSVPTCVTDVKPFEIGTFTKKADQHFEVKYVASMWQFQPHEITVPVGSTLDLFVTSKDVTHGFQILGTNINLMAVPGSINYAQAKFSKPGRYLIVCHEYCGVGHQGMYGTVIVSDGSQPEPPSSDVSSGPPSDKGAANALSVAAGAGKVLFETRGCAACHTVDGTTTVGPSLKGVSGRKVEFQDGGHQDSDDDYLFDSIKNPKNKIVKGFDKVSMIELPLTDDEIHQLVEFLKTL